MSTIFVADSYEQYRSFRFKARYFKSQKTNSLDELVQLHGGVHRPG
jgi:hypothetical protein